MDELPVGLLPLVPWMVIAYALAFVAGGIYSLEQRVARVRDQFPSRAPLARLTGYAALAIGFLAAVSIGGHLIRPDTDYHLGALVATSAGVAFWIHHLSGEHVALYRIRDALLAAVCACVTALTVWWISAS